MKIVVAGGSGQVGQILARRFLARGDDVVVLARGSRVDAGRAVAWDGRHLGDWAREIDGADAVVNLAGRSVNCRYTDANLRDMLESRVDSTRVVGEAIARAARPPRVWLQMSTRRRSMPTRSARLTASPAALSVATSRGFPATGARACALRANGRRPSPRRRRPPRARSPSAPPW
jgi:NAD dependent epimerase/dehydratase family enzyme